MSRPNAEVSVDLGSPAVDSQLMQEPVLYGLASVLGKVEHWVYDRDKPGHASEPEREIRLRQAAIVLSRVLNRLPASIEVVEFIVSLSSRRRFVLLTMFQQSNPALTGDLTQCAYQNREQSRACAHYIHWLDVVQRAQQIQQIFSAENAAKVCAVLARSKQRPAGA